MGLPAFTLLTRVMERRMKEKTLLRIAAVVSIIGIAGLMVLARGIEVDEAMISRLDEMEDESVVVEGVVMAVHEGEGVVFVMLQKDETVGVTLFGEVPVMETGNLIQVRGEVQEEEGKVTIIGEEVRVI
jgi:RecJ-like exonuclease